MRVEGVLFRCHAFDAACADLDIEHRLTKPMHPWTNGQVERMNRTIKEATVKRYHYDDHAQLERHLGDFIAAQNFGRRLKTLKVSRPTSTSATVGQRARTLQAQSAPANAGTKHLNRFVAESAASVDAMSTRSTASGVANR